MDLWYTQHFSQCFVLAATGEEVAVHYSPFSNCLPRLSRPSEFYDRVLVTVNSTRAVTRAVEIAYRRCIYNQKAFLVVIQISLF